MANFGVRCTESEKEYFNKIMNLAVEKYPDKIQRQPDALRIIFELFEGKTTPETEFDPQVENTINEINCQYITHNTLEGFQCLEHFWRTKKPMPIGSNSIRVIDRCTKCKIGKDDQTVIMVNTMLLKKGVKGIVDLRDSLLHIAKEGAIAQIYLCRADQFIKNRLILSADGENLECPLEDNNLVNVKKHCYQAIDPATMTKPCQHLLDPFVKVKLKVSESAQEVFDGMKRLPSPTEEKKKIEVESTVISE